MTTPNRFEAVLQSVRAADDQARRDAETARVPERERVCMIPAPTALAIEGLHHWFQTLLAELSETDLALRQTMPTGDDTTRGILSRVQDRLEQARRERASHRYTAARDTVAEAYRILRMELHPHLAQAARCETDPAVQQRLAAWVDILNDLFEGEAA